MGAGVGVGVRVGRTPSDVAALLVELGRVLKAREFYPAGDPALAELVDRSDVIVHLAAAPHDLADPRPSSGVLDQEDRGARRQRLRLL